MGKRVKGPHNKRKCVRATPKNEKNVAMNRDKSHQETPARATTSRALTPAVNMSRAGDAVNQAKATRTMTTRSMARALWIEKFTGGDAVNQAKATRTMTTRSMARALWMEKFTGREAPNKPKPTRTTMSKTKALRKEKDAKGAKPTEGTLESRAEEVTPSCYPAPSYVSYQFMPWENPFEFFRAKYGPGATFHVVYPAVGLGNESGSYKPTQELDLD